MSFKSRVKYLQKVIRWGISYPSTGKSTLNIIRDYLNLYKKSGLTLSEYQNYGFDHQTELFRSTFIGLEERRLYLDVLNPVIYHCCCRNKFMTHKLLEDTGIRKTDLLCYYQPEGQLVKSIKVSENISDDLSSTLEILRRKNVNKCVVKVTEGSHGDGVYVVKCIEYSEADACLELFDGSKILLSSVLGKDPLIFESLVQQTEQFSKLNDSSVNTVRFMTLLFPDGTAKVMATFIKIGRAGKCIDNAGSGGNVDACVDIDTGAICKAIQFDGWKKVTAIDVHPDTGNQLNGVVINRWDAIKQDVIKFQQAFPYCRAAGWDIAITDEGPVVIEVNDAWDPTGQYFCQKGWRKEIQECYLAWKKVGKKYSNRGVCNLTKHQIEKLLS